MMGNFGIGIWQSLQNGQPYPSASQSIPIIDPGTGVVQQPAIQMNANVDPYATTYGGTYGFALYTNIRSPQQVSFVPAPEISLDARGASVVRGFPQMIWQYNQMRPDFWYYLRYLYKLSSQNAPADQYLVLLQYPDSTQGNTLTQVLARWEPPTHNVRTQAAYIGVQLKFTYIGQAVLASNVPIVTVSV